MDIEDVCSLPLFLSAFSYQLLLYCWTVNQWTNPGFKDESAVGVLAFIFLLAAFLFIIQLNIGELQGNKIASISATVLHFLAAFFILVQISIYGKRAGDRRVGSNLLSSSETYGYVGYISVMVLSMMAGVVLIIETLRSRSV